MRITVCLTDNKTAPWLQGLRAALPRGRTSQEWAPGAPQADHAVVWAPPQQFLDEQPRLKGIFNIGAGVDALLKLKLPRGREGGAHRRRRHGGADGRVRVPCADPAFPRTGLLRGRCRGTARGRYRRPRQPGGVSRWASWAWACWANGWRRPWPHFEFPVLGWSRTPKTVPGVRCFAGQEQFDAFLGANARAGVPAAADARNRRTS